MQRVDRYKYNIAAAVHQLYYFVDPAVIVLHFNQTAEYANTVVDVDNIIAKVE